MPIDRHEREQRKKPREKQRTQQTFVPMDESAAIEKEVSVSLEAPLVAEEMSTAANPAALIAPRPRPATSIAYMFEENNLERVEPEADGTENRSKRSHHRQHKVSKHH